MVYLFWWIPWSAAKLVQLSPIGEDDESNLGIAKDGKLVGFLQKTISSLCKGHLPVDLVFNPLQLHSSSSHFPHKQTKHAKHKIFTFFSFLFYTENINSYFGSVSVGFVSLFILSPSKILCERVLLRILVQKHKIIIKQQNLVIN